jgi:hypothetical protein
MSSVPVGTSTSTIDVIVSPGTVTMTVSGGESESLESSLEHAAATSASTIPKRRYARSRALFRIIAISYSCPVLLRIARDAGRDHKETVRAIL